MTALEAILEQIRIHSVTKNDISMFREQLSFLRDVIYKDSFWNVSDTSVVFSKLSDAINTLGINVNDYSDLSALRADLQHQESTIIALEQKLSSLNYMHVTLSFSPTKEYLKMLKTVLTENLGQHMVLDVNFDLNILGGVVLDWKGKRIDMSINSMIDQYFSSIKNDLIPIV